MYDVEVKSLFPVEVRHFEQTTEGYYRAAGTWAQVFSALSTAASANVARACPRRLFKVM